MLGLIWIYFIGKPFFQLAEEFYKNKWLYGILGVVVFYATQFLAGILLGLLSLVFSYDLLQLNELLLTLLCLPFCVLACWGLYRLLKSRWSNENKRNEKALNDNGIIDEQLMD